MDTNAVAKAFCALLAQGKHAEAGAQFWSDDIVSLEPMGMGGQTRWEGRAAVKGKSDWWANTHEIHSLSSAGPYVNGDTFIVTFAMDVTNKENGQRFTGTEAGLYTVRNGKIAQEEFFMAPMG
jgi:ketosteroid isomerase-like protein